MFFCKFLNGSVDKNFNSFHKNKFDLALKILEVFVSVSLVAFPVVGYLNISSVKEKLYFKEILLNAPINILCVDEVKLTRSLFNIEGYQFPPGRKEHYSNSIILFNIFICDFFLMIRVC